MTAEERHPGSVDMPVPVEDLTSARQAGGYPVLEVPDAFRISVDPSLTEDGPHQKNKTSRPSFRQTQGN